MQQDKWAQGAVETAESAKIDRRDELAELRSKSIKDRFHEANNNEAPAVAPRGKMEIDASCKL